MLFADACEARSSVHSVRVALRSPMVNSWWLSDAMQDHGMVYVVSWIVWVIASIVLHELAHGWTAIRCGDDVPLHSGHMTINPFVHIPPMAWIMFLLVGITWGLMPVQPANFRGRYDDAKVAAAGPLVNVLLAVGASLAFVLWRQFGQGVGNDALYVNLQQFLFVGTMLNLVLACFNLLPAPPLDGSRILANFVPAYNRLWEGDRGQIAVIVVFAVVFIFAGRIIWPVAAELTGVLVDFWQGLLPAPVRAAP